MLPVLAMDDDPEANHAKHLAAELKRKDRKTIILALHPGEVATCVIFSLCAVLCTTTR